MLISAVKRELKNSQQRKNTKAVGGIEVKKKKKEPRKLDVPEPRPTPPHPLLREETQVKACLPWGLGVTPNTRGCKHFSSHINRRDSSPDTLEFSCQEPVAKQK